MHFMSSKAVGYPEKWIWFLRVISLLDEYDIGNVDLWNHSVAIGKFRMKTDIFN